MSKNLKPLNPLSGPGLRGCWGTTKRKGTHRFCAQKAIVWYGTEGFCYTTLSGPGSSARATGVDFPLHPLLYFRHLFARLLKQLAG